jgi:hypothetical protein
MLCRTSVSGRGSRAFAPAALAAAAVVAGVFGTGTARAGDVTSVADLSASIQAEVAHEVRAARDLAGAPPSGARGERNSHASLADSVAQAARAEVEEATRAIANDIEAATSTSAARVAPAREPARAGVAARSTAEPAGVPVDDLGEAIGRAVDAAVQRGMAPLRRGSETGASIADAVNRAVERGIDGAGPAVRRPARHRTEGFPAGPASVPAPPVSPPTGWREDDAVAQPRVEARHEVRTTARPAKTRAERRGDPPARRLPPGPIPDPDASFGSESGAPGTVVPPLLVALAAISFLFALGRPGPPIPLPALRGPRGAVVRPWRPG